MVKQLFFAFLISLPLSLTIFAQVKDETLPKAVLVDEVGDVPPSDFIARLDNLTVALQNNPGAKAFIIAYRTQAEPPGKNVRVLEGCRIYLTRNRRFDPETLALVDGGIAGVSLTQLWVVPPGTTPKPRTDAYPKVIEDRNSAREYDEFYYSLGDEESYGFYNRSSLETFAVQIKAEPGATAYVIVYPQYYVDRYEVEDERGKKQTVRNVYRDANKFVEQMSREIIGELTKKHNLPRNRIRVINGGYRKLRQVELWILPGGEHPPIATPNAFPKSNNRKRKK